MGHEERVAEDEVGLLVVETGLVEEEADVVESRREQQREVRLRRRRRKVAQVSLLRRRRGRLEVKVGGGDQRETVLRFSMTLFFG